MQRSTQTNNVNNNNTSIILTRILCNYILKSAARDQLQSQHKYKSKATDTRENNKQANKKS
jgi:hypothetical protein